MIAWKFPLNSVLKSVFWSILLCELLELHLARQIDGSQMFNLQISKQETE